MSRPRALARLGLAFALGAAAVSATTEEVPLTFTFLEEPPGALVRAGALRLHLHCRGRGTPGGATVVFENGLGGSSLEWGPVADTLAPRARVCTYDRAGYAWSDPSAQPRDAARLARELDLLLETAAIEGPLVLVAHSFGGFVARLFIERRPDDVAALVLVDASHEEQFARLEGRGRPRMVPRGRQFVLSRMDAPEGLPAPIRRQIRALGRMRKTYAATHGEMSAFRESAARVAEARARRDGPYPFPVTVLRRGRDLYAQREDGAARTATWRALQEDFAALGTPGRVVVAEGSGHHVHAEAPALVAREIERLLDALEGDARGTEAGGGGRGADGGEDGGARGTR